MVFLLVVVLSLSDRTDHILEAYPPKYPPLDFESRGFGTASRTDTTANEAEHEGSISRDLRRDLELCRGSVSGSPVVFRASW